MKTQAVKCNKCEDIIFSRARHDLRSCSCGSLAVDGGHFNGINWVIQRIIGNNPPKTAEWLQLNVDEATLFDDWNQKKDNYGLIKGNPKKKEIIELKPEENTIKEGKTPLEEFNEKIVSKVDKNIKIKADKNLSFRELVNKTEIKKKTTKKK